MLPHRIYVLITQESYYYANLLFLKYNNNALTANCSHFRQKLGINVNILTVSITYELRDVITHFISEFFLISQSFLIVGRLEIIAGLTYFNLQILSVYYSKETGDNKRKIIQIFYDCISKCLNFLYLLNDKVMPSGLKGGLEILNLLYELPGCLRRGGPAIHLGY